MKKRTCDTRFRITDDMVRRFIDLTGDSSSLHTDKMFARRSMYRDVVVHGMLPVIFLSASRNLYVRGSSFSFKGISAKFHKPIFAGDALVLSARVSKIDKENIAELEYAVKRLDRGTVVITGNSTVSYSRHPADGIDSRGRRASSARSMVDGVIREQVLRIEQIFKDDKKSFEFLISKKHISWLFEIISDGISAYHRMNLSAWSRACDPINLMAASLFSTFVGMCIPGKYAAFIDFSAEFRKPLRPNRIYLLTGRVGFKSQSASAVAEEISIHAADDEKDVHAAGKITARVNEPPAKMPSIGSLKEKSADLGLKDKVVLVTGASRGIGETISKLFSVYGAKVAVNYFRGAKDARDIVGEMSSSGGDAMAVKADVSNRQEVSSMVSAICRRFGTIDILVNNAVRDTYPIPFIETTWNDFQRDIDVVVKGAFNCCQEVLPLMMKKNAGKIVNISTVFADNPPPHQSKYVVSKNGLVGLSRSLAVEFAPYNIQVNMVSPSMVKTDLTSHVSKIFLEAMKNDIPMKRNAAPIDVAKAVVFLSSSMAPFTTGQKIMVTGGLPPFL